MKRKNNRNLILLLVASVFSFGLIVAVFLDSFANEESPSLHVASVRLRRDGKVMATLELRNNMPDEIEIAGNGNGQICYFNYVYLQGRWMYFDWRFFATEVEDECLRTNSDVEVYRSLRPGERVFTEIEVDEQCQRNRWFVGVLARKADGSIMKFATDMLVPKISSGSICFELTDNWVYKQNRNSSYHPSAWGLFTHVDEE